MAIINIKGIDYGIFIQIGVDKNEFQNLIRNMKKICEKNQSYEENICQDIISKQIWLINSLDNKNKDIKRRLEKMKNVFK